MSNQNQATKKVLAEARLTSQQVKQALVNIVKAELYYRKPKDRKFMQSYKERVKKLRQSEDSEQYVVELA